MAAKVRDGVVKRGGSWSYDVRDSDPESGASRPRWVGGFPTESAVKAARDEARVAGRRGEYVDRSSMTVASYLREWLAEAPKTKGTLKLEVDVDPQSFF